MAKLIRLLDRYQWVLLAAAAPFLISPSPRRSLALLVIPLIFLIGWLARREPIPPTPLNGSLLLMAFMVLVSLWVTQDPAASYEEVARILLGFAAYFCLANYARSPGGLRWSLVFFILIGPGIAGIGLLGTQWITEKLNILTRIADFFPARWTGLARDASGFNANALAGGLVLVLPLLVTCTITLYYRSFSRPVQAEGGRKPWLPRLQAIGMGLVTLFVLSVFLLAQSRGAYLALAVILGVMLWWIAPRSWRIALAGIGLVGIVGLAVFLLKFSADPILKAPIQGSLLNGETLPFDVLDSRIELWSRAIKAIQDFPLTGMGMGAFRQSVQRLYPLFLTPSDVDVVHAHNEFLQAALDLGIPGLIAFIGLYMGAFAMLVQLSHLDHKSAGLPVTDETSLPMKALILGLGGGLAAYLLFSMVDVHVLTGRRGIIFWLLLGLIAGLHSCYAAGARPDLTRLALSGASGEPRLQPPQE
jgi:putative inorganic carbon (HCO3(-)) transporter